MHVHKCGPGATVLRFGPVGCLLSRATMSGAALRCCSFCVYLLPDVDVEEAAQARSNPRVQLAIDSMHAGLHEHASVRARALC